MGPTAARAAGKGGLWGGRRFLGLFLDLFFGQSLDTTHLEAAFSLFRTLLVWSAGKRELNPIKDIIAWFFICFFLFFSCIYSLYLNESAYAKVPL